MDRVRPAWAVGSWFCLDCGSVFGENTGQWVRGISTSSGTEADSGFVPFGKVPANVCVYCESTRIEPPTMEGE